MLYPKIPLAQSIIEILKTKEIKNIVISPGSRNAPLTIGFVNNPYFTCYSIADERCAAFFALGIAQQIQEPVVVVCTSGSALLNYYPAYAEAFYSQIPLVVVSADRPQNKIDIGDGQTIRQENVFANHSLYNANLTEENSEENNLKIALAIDTAFQKKGPVHINAPFEEPLYQTVDTLEVAVNLPKVAFEEPKINTDEVAACMPIWNQASKKIILVGEKYPNTIDQAILESLAQNQSVIVMTETTANLHQPSFFNSIDTLITPFDEDEFKKMQPDILVTFGGMVVSKRIKSFLRSYPPKHHWHIDSLRAYDTYGCLTKHFVGNANDFFKQLVSFEIKTETNYFDYFNKIVQKRKLKRIEYLSQVPFSDFSVFDTVLASLPQNSMLQLSNSSSIRYAQLFDIHKSIHVFCNRGTSGIDGSTSTAIGAAVASQKQTVFIAGDIGFLYDSNALWNNYIPKNFKIILINNGGGGIFRILPGHQETEVFNTFFETSHQLTAQHLAAMYALDYAAAHDIESLQDGLEKMYLQNQKPFILEVFTPTAVNDKVLLDYFKYNV